MQRYFNVAGPCVPAKHYLLPTSERCAEIHSLIASEMFFVIHAARQSGKTTLLNALQQDLEAGGRYHALYCSLESVQGIVDAREGIPSVVKNLVSRLPYMAAAPTPPEVSPDSGDFTNMLRIFFEQLCGKLD
ncbi:MAG: hypothetical protein NTW21_20030, partial [Verrucomicrobia bacterium]|nr:hypothetical protein [Verrucomicrobiota bacterium]